MRWHRGKPFLPVSFSVRASVIHELGRSCRIQPQTCPPALNPAHLPPYQPPPTASQGVNAVVFSGFGCAHRVAVDIGMEPGWPVVDKAYKGLLNFVRDRS